MESDFKWDSSGSEVNDTIIRLTPGGGEKVDFKWISNGFKVDLKWVSRDFEWILSGFQMDFKVI